MWDADADADLDAHEICTETNMYSITYGGGGGGNNESLCLIWDYLQIQPIFSFSLGRILRIAETAWRCFRNAT